MRTDPADYAEFHRDEARFLADRPLPPFDRIDGFPAPGPNLSRMAAKLAGQSELYEKALAGTNGATTAAALVLDAFLPQARYLTWKLLYVPKVPLLYWSHRARPPVALPTLSGTRMGLESYGPRPLPVVPGVTRPEVMLVGRAPGREDFDYGCCFSGGAVSSLFRALEESRADSETVAGWYATNLVKWASPTPGSDKTPKALVTDGRFLLACEIWALCPDYVLALGLEAVKELAGPRENVGLMVGRAVTRTFPRFEREAEEEERHEDTRPTVVMASQSPGAVARKPEQYVELRDAVARFAAVVAGRSADFTETDVTHWAVRTEAQLAAHVDRAIAEHDPRDGAQPIALDAEWEGRYPTEPGSWLRTVQFSHRAKYACVIEIRDEQGEPCFEGGPEAVTRQLTRLLMPTPERGVRIGGHVIRADLPWLRAKLGLDLRSLFAPASSEEATRFQGGFDSLYLIHAVHEALGRGGYKLEALAARFCGVPRYDLALQEWKRARRAADEELNGYGFCPRAILVGRTVATDPELGDRLEASYAGYDADAVMRLFDLTNGRRGEPGLLDRDDFGLSSRRAWWISQRAMLGFLEMETHGLIVDRDRVDALVHTLDRAVDRLKANFRRRLRWRNFNPNSDVHRREFLFGEALNGSRDKETAQPRRSRPDYVTAIPNVRPRTPELEPWQPVSLGLEPIKPSGVKGKSWADLKALGKEKDHAPAADRVTLEILAGHHPLVAQLRDIRTCQTQLQTVLRRPERDATGAPLLDADGHWIYGAGLLSWVHADGRIRTNFFPVETRRCSSSRPPLQNISKSKDEQLAVILGSYVRDPKTGEIKPAGSYLNLFDRPLYRFPPRSILRSTPGRVLVEVDYTGAELAVMAWQSNDPQMIEDVGRNLLPEDHPDFLDLHAQTAVSAFRLDCEPTKNGLGSIGKSYLRVGAKPINFGVPYGISPAAIVLKCLSEGVSISLAEATAMRDGYFTRWPRTRDYLDEAAARVVDPGWIAGPHGGLRRFYADGVDERVLAGLFRQAWNYTIQNGVADTINQATGELLAYRDADGGRPRFDLVLQVHDALLLECDPEDVEYTIAAARECMCARVPIYPRCLDGSPLGTGPYRFGISVDLYEFWGVKLTDKRALELGAPDRAAVKRLIAA